MSYKLLVFIFIFIAVNICTKTVKGEHFSTSIEFKEDEGKKFEKVEASDLDWETLKQLVNDSDTKYLSPTRIGKRIGWNQVADGFAKVVGGAINLFQRIGEWFQWIANKIGLIPRQRSFIIDNKSGCFFYIWCYSTFENFEEQEIDDDDGGIVKFTVSFWRPDWRTNWQCRVRTENNQEFTFNAYGSGSMREAIVIYEITQHVIERMDKMIYKIKYRATGSTRIWNPIHALTYAYAPERRFMSYAPQCDRYGRKKREINNATTTTNKKPRRELYNSGKSGWWPSWL